MMVSIACSHKNDAVTTSEQPVVIGYPAAGQESKNLKPQAVKTAETKSAYFIPKATAFRMSGDFEDNVAVTLNADGELTYFPAPSDITADSRPVSLGDGWWLNNQGLSPKSVFTKYTFAQYAALTEVPSPSQLKKEIIPGAMVTQFIELPFDINQARNNLQEIKDYLKDK